MSINNFDKFDCYLIWRLVITEFAIFEDNAMAGLISLSEEHTLTVYTSAGGGLGVDAYSDTQRTRYVSHISDFLIRNSAGYIEL